jgi:hypothetical protein
MVFPRTPRAAVARWLGQQESPSMHFDFCQPRYVYEGSHCAVVTSDDGSYLLGYFRAPRHEWTYLTTFKNEATARRAFDSFDGAVTSLRRALGSNADSVRFHLDRRGHAAPAC